MGCGWEEDELLCLGHVGLEVSNKSEEVWGGEEDLGGPGLCVGKVTQEERVEPWSASINRTGRKRRLRKKGTTNLIVSPAEWFPSVQVAGASLGCPWEGIQGNRKDSGVSLFLPLSPSSADPVFIDIAKQILLSPRSFPSVIQTALPTPKHLTWGRLGGKGLAKQSR